MKFSSLRNKAFSLVVAIAMTACYSMVALAGEGKISGEITIAGNSGSTVTVNGEGIKSGRTIFSSSIISTPEDASAIVSVKGLGKLKISPNSTMSLSFTEDGISGSLSNGKVSVLNATDTVSISGPDGKSAKLSAGESVTTVQDDDDDDDNSHLALILVFAGVVAATTIYVLMSRDDDLGNFVVSPTS